MADVPDVAHEVDFVGFVKCAYMTSSLSRSFEGAVRLREAAIWKGATDAETGAHQEHDVYTLCRVNNVPPGNKIIRTT